MKRLALALLVLCAASGRAHADPIDLLGFGARATALGQAVTALELGAASALYNPAAVALSPDPEVHLGYAGAGMGLSINGGDAGVVSPRGLTFGLALPIKLGGGIVFAPAVGLYFPDPWVVRLQLVPSTEPHYLLLDNDVNRIVTNVVAGLKLAPWLSIGAGATVLADVAGNGIRFDVGVQGGMRVGEGSLDITVPTRAAPVVGVLLRPHDRIRLGMSYRGEIALKLRLDVVANVNVAGVVVGDAIIALGATNFFTPAKLAFGAGFDVTDRLTLSADLVYAHWRGFQGAQADLQILVDLGVSPSLAQATFPQDRFNDTLTPRLGAEYRLPLLASGPTLALRGGFGYEPSPIPDQVLLTSFADNDRLVLSGGAGVELPSHPGGILERPISLDFSAQYHAMMSRDTRKLNTALPSFSSDGHILSASATLQVRF